MQDKICVHMCSTINVTNSIYFQCLLFKHEKILISNIFLLRPTAWSFNAHSDVFQLKATTVHYVEGRFLAFRRLQKTSTLENERVPAPTVHVGALSFFSKCSGVFYSRIGRFCCSFLCYQIFVLQFFMSSDIFIGCSFVLQ